MKTGSKKKKPVKTRRLILARALVPRELAILRTRLPDDALGIFEFVSQSQKDTTVQQSAEVDSAQLNQFYARLATGLWRIRQKMVKPGTNEPLTEVRIAFRHLDSTWNLLIEQGIEIKDFTNQPFNLGMMLNVISREPTAGLKREMIIETIKPTVFLKGEPIQIGDVVVGTPAGDE